jgi:hypothetical protein
MSKITASFIYSGLPDYWGGEGRRNDNDAGCLFAFYGASTTLRDIIDSAADDFFNGGDFDYYEGDTDPWEGVSRNDVRDALLECLTEQGRADYDSNAVSEFALDYAAINGFDSCRECGHNIGELHSKDCERLADLIDDCGPDAVDNPVDEEDCEPDYDYCDSPMIVFLLEIEE